MRDKVQPIWKWLGWLALVAILVIVLVHPDQRQAVVGGIGTGAFYAALALAVVLTFRGTGVVNFSVGAVAMFAGYVYYDARQNGRMFLPPISLGAPQTVLVSFTIAVVVSAVLGILLHFVVFRPLRAAPTLAKVVASIGVMVLLQAIAALKFTSTALPVPPIIHDHPIAFLGLDLSFAQVVLAAIVIAMTIAFWAAFRFTKLGLALRASAENEQAAILFGYSPDVLAGASWILSTLVAGVLGVLVSSVNGTVDPNTLPLLIVPALGAALMGGLSSFGVAAAAAFALAAAQDWIQLLGTQSWFPHAQGAPLPGLTDALPLVVIVVVLAIKGRSLPSRDALLSPRLPVAPSALRSWRVPIAMLGVVTCTLFFVGPVWRIAATNSITGAMVCLSLVTLTGLTGQISLAQMAFAGVSGFALAKVAPQAGIPLPVGLVIGAMASAVFGLVFSLPALRIRGVHLAIVTLAAAVAMQDFVFANPSWAGQTGGVALTDPRLVGIPIAPTATYHFGDQKFPDPVYGVVCLVVLLGIVFIVNNVRRSQLGSHMLAVRANERAAAALGVNAVRTKVAAFTLSAFIAGIGGVLAGYGSGVVTADEFGVSASVLILAFAYLGGISSIGGAVIAALFLPGGILAAATQQVGINADYLDLLAGVGVILNAIQAPEGIAGVWLRSAHAIRRRVTTRWLPNARGREDESGPPGGGGESDPSVERVRVPVDAA